MSDTATQGASQGAPSGTPTAAPAGAGNQSNGGQQGSQEYNNPFLNEVEEAHRPIVAPYLQKWDANATRRFQELQSQLQPWQQLGADPESVQQALMVQQMINEQPQVILQALQEALAEDDGDQGLDQQGQEQTLQGLPKELQTQIQRLESGLTAIAEHILEQNRSVQEQQEDEQLEQMLSSAKEQFGDFDDDYVLTKMYAGQPIEQAIQSYQQLTQQVKNQLSQSTKSLPKATLGGGSVPNPNSQSVKDLSRKDTQELVKSILAQANQE